MHRTTLLLAVFVAAIAANAQISPQYHTWENSALRFLMMKHEKTEWAAVRTDADAKAFFDLFWARRDPTPDTPVNELRQQIETRIAEADKRYRFTKTPGSQTDQGLVYVLLGEPDEIVTAVRQPFASTMPQFQRPVNVHSWIYKDAKATRVTGAKPIDIGFRFHDDKLAGLFELDGPSQKVFDETTLTIAKSLLTRPFMTAEDLAAGGVSERTVPFQMIVVADSTIAYDVLRRAQEGENFSDLARKYSSHASAQHGGYVGHIPFADLTEDFKVAFTGKEPGAAFLIARSPQYAIVRILTDAEAAAADAEMPKSQ
jgi:GWxTD domain-containing protein